METLLNHVAVTSVFWTVFILLAFATLAVVAVTNEKFVLLNLSLVVTLALLSPLFKQVTLATFLAGAFVYLLVGCGWAVVRWGRYAELKITAYKDRQEERRQDRGRTFSEQSEYRYLMDDVNPANNKSRIFHWLFYWPFSVVDWCISDLFKTIYDQLAKVLKAYTARLLARHDVQPPTELP